MAEFLILGGLVLGMGSWVYVVLFIVLPGLVG